VRIIITLFIVWVCAAVTPFGTAVSAAFIFKLLSTPTAVVSVVPLSLRIVAVSVVSVVSSSSVVS